MLLAACTAAWRGGVLLLHAGRAARAAGAAAVRPRGSRCYGHATDGDADAAPTAEAPSSTESRGEPSLVVGFMPDMFAGADPVLAGLFDVRHANRSDARRAQTKAVVQRLRLHETDVGSTAVQSTGAGGRARRGRR